MKRIELEKKVLECCKKTQLEKENKKKAYYPCVTVVCSSRASRDFACGQSSRCSHIYYNPLILRQFHLLHGKIGNFAVNTDCMNKIGFCAEPHAAQKFLNKCHVLSVSDLVFSTARVTRTNEIKPYCNNCCITFNLRNR